MILMLHLLCFIVLLPCFLMKFNRTRLNFVITGWVAAALATTAIAGVVGTAGIIAIGAVVALTVYGGLALLLTRKTGGLANSPTYAQATLQTQTNPDLPVPLLYGTVKLAGNRIWQNETKEKNIKRIVAFAEGEITDFTDIRLNDIEYNKVKGCKIEKFYGTSEQGLPSMVKLDEVGSLKNVAYLAIICNKTNKVDINYNLTAIVKGRKVRVYTSPTKYEVKYSENPAWVMFDFLTSYNGLGIALDNQCNVSDELISELFDLETFIESAAFCDELIEYTVKEKNDKDEEVIVTKRSPRFTFNMIFDSQTSARDLIDEIYRSCRGGLFTKNGKLQFKIDKQEPLSMIFTEEDIIKGSETFQVIPAEENYEILRCTYISPEHEWQKVEAFAEIPEYRYGAPVEHSVNIYSCTNFQQASRLAWYYVNSKSLCPYFGSFATDFRAYGLEVGDVIQINSLLMGLKDYKVKITSVSDDGSGVFTINWRNYDERLYNDTLGSQEPRVLVSVLDDIASFPEDVQNFNVVQSQSYFNFVWQYNENNSDTYEIRYGESWDFGTVIAKGLANNTYTWAIPTDGLYKFWIKAFNNYNYSKNATLDVCSVDAIPEINEIIKINVLESLDGEFNNTYNYHNTIKLNVNNVKWQNTNNTWGNDNYYQTLGFWGANVVNEGSYTSKVYDIGAVLKCIMVFEHQYTSPDDSQDVIIEWRYSDDEVTWSNWTICNLGEYTFRYCQFRATLRAYNNAQIVLNAFNVSVDVPDKELELDIETTQEGGFEISYNFIKEPSIIGTVNDDVNAYVVIKNKTNTRATVYTYLNDGTQTSAKVNLRLKGY
jgi:hypothetical protein